MNFSVLGAETENDTKCWKLDPSTPDAHLEYQFEAHNLKLAQGTRAQKNIKKSIFRNIFEF